MQGLVGRESRQIRLEVCPNTRQATVQPLIEAKCEADARLFTDESHAYNGVAASGRGHATVCHSKKEWARDDDDDGFCEVHCNTCEGIWTGLRNFLRPFRGVSKRYLAQYVAVFELIYNFKELPNLAVQLFITPDFWLQMLLSP